MDQQNSAMISKLMSRKKSYERMMNIEDTIGNGGRAQAYNINDLSSKKSQDVLLSAARPSQLGRINNSQTSVKKQLNYYDSTPQQSHNRKMNSGLRNRNGGNNGSNSLTP